MDVDVMDPLDVIVVGAGFSGICALTRIRQEFPEATVECFEGADEIGGTWAKNTYPRLSCDIPSHLYSYSFAPNPAWTSTYATQPEIKTYLRWVVSTYDCVNYIYLEYECVSARWLDDQSLWRIVFRSVGSGRSCVRHARFLITAMGFADKPRGADDIRGIETFEGSLFHSAQWDHDFVFRDKSVIVIGNGSSANQFVPWLLEESGAREVVQVARSAHWMASKGIKKINWWQRWMLRNVPWAGKGWRCWLALKFDLAFRVFKKDAMGNFLRARLEASVASYMRRESPQRYHDILIPEFELGAKRIVLDHGYLNSLYNPRMTLVQADQVAVSGPRSVAVGQQRKIYPADVLILANGFRTQELLAPMEIHGLNEAELLQRWREDGGASAYMGVSVAGFPNLFLLTGPNTLPTSHSTLIGIESSVEYIIRVLRQTAPKKPGSLGKVKIQVREDAQKRFNDQIQTRMKSLTYTPDVPNWYANRETGRNTLIWPGSQFQFWWSRCVRAVQWSDFEVERI